MQSQTQYAGQGQSPAAKLTQIENQFVNLSEALEIQQKCIQELSERLVPILMQQEPPAKMTAAPKPVLVPLAERINSATSHARDNTSIIRAIISRIEL